jgi:hypothetical protein
MNDEFLTRHRTPPRREFAAALYERINQPMNTRSLFSQRRFTIAAALCLALVAAIAVSPGARAAVTNFIREIGGITFIGPDDTAAETPVPESEIQIVPDELVTLNVAQAKLPFEISLPTWVPDGFDMGPSVRITYFSDQNTPATLTWFGSDPSNAIIELVVGQRVNWLVDLDHVQEVTVNGLPAALTGGGWDADTGEWNGGDPTLTWLRGDTMYILRSPGGSPKDLIRMAESIP